jgi:uncharacterized membrane protein required for colicin V production
VAVAFVRPFVYHPIVFTNYATVNWVYLDVGLLALLAVFAIVGLLKGIGAEVVSCAAVTGALVITYATRTLVVHDLLGWLQRRFPQAHFDSVLSSFAAVIVLLFVSYLLLGAAFDAVRLRVLGRTPPGLLSRIYGMLLGGAKGVFVIVALVWLADVTTPLAGRVLSSADVTRYENLRDQAQIVAASRAALGTLRVRWSLISNALCAAEAAFSTPDTVTNNIAAPQP